MLTIIVVWLTQRHKPNVNITNGDDAAANDCAHCGSSSEDVDCEDGVWYSAEGLWGKQRNIVRGVLFSCPHLLSSSPDLVSQVYGTAQAVSESWSIVK